MSAASIPARTRRRGIPVSELRAARLQREAAERKQRIACCAAIKAYLLDNLKSNTTTLKLTIEPHRADDPRTDCFCEGLYESGEFKALCATFERHGGWCVRGWSENVEYKTRATLCVTPIE